MRFCLKLSKHLPFAANEIKNALDELIEEGVLHLHEDKLIQKRMVKDAKISLERTMAGKKGGSSKKKLSSEDTVSDDAVESEQHSVVNDFADNFANDFVLAKTQANSEYENEIEIENEIETEDDNYSKSSVSEKRKCSQKQFDIFWKTYPKKVAKANAEKAWGKINPDNELFEKIINAVRKQSKSDQWVKDGGKFIPHAATWLNAKRWEDEIIIPAISLYENNYDYAALENREWKNTRRVV